MQVFYVNELNSPVTVSLTATNLLQLKDIFVVCEGSNLVVNLPSSENIKGIPNIYFVSVNNTTTFTINVQSPDFIALPNQPTSFSVSGGNSYIVKSTWQVTSQYPSLGNAFIITSIGGGSSATGTLWGQFQMEGGVSSYNIQTILGFRVSSVIPVFFDATVLQPNTYSFNQTTQMLTFEYEQDGIWIQFGYTT